MRYTITQSDDPEMYQFWNTYTVAGKTQPMLCMIIHSDCLSSGIVDIVKTVGEVDVYFEVVKEGE